MSMLEPQRREGPGCWKIGLIGCGAVAVLFVIAIFGFAYYVSRNVGVKDITACTSNMIEVTKALERYETRNANYPDDLNALVPTFLSKPQVLRCPSDKTPTGDTSYRYIKPALGAPDTTIVLVCEKHKMFGKQVAFQMQKNGKMKGAEPGSTPK